MKSLLVTYTKNNLILFISCLILVFLNITNFANFNFVTFILLTVLAYDLNVNDKLRGNWGYLESLPISLNKRFALKVLIPFAFIVLVDLGMQSKMDLIFFLDQGFSRVLLYASVLILASVLAKKLNSFILYLFALNILAFCLSFLPNHQIVLAMAYLIGSYYILSNKRVDPKTIAISLLAIITPLVLTLHFMQVPLFEKLISAENSEISFFAAKNLIKEKENSQAINVLSDRVATTEDENTFKEALELLTNNSIPLNFEQTKWYELFLEHTSGQKQILRHLTKNSSQYGWIAHSNLFQFEDELLDGKKCKSKCRRLAKLVSKNASSIDSQRMLSHLNSDSKVRKLYALNVLKQLKSGQYKNEVIELLSDNNKDVKKLSFEFLRNITKEDLKMELEKIEKDLSVDDSIENIEKAKAFFKSKL